MLLGLLFVTVSCQPDIGLASESDLPAPELPAFPGAEGFGASAIGGRGGQVIEVTNLNDSGPGSLRAAIDAEGPRTVVFRTGGTIELQSRLEIVNPYITIAGQTAPGDGITLKNASANRRTPLRIATHDVIIRYIRSRPGPSTEISSSLDALEIVAGYNIIIDHSSFSWAVDENLSTYAEPHDITIQWSIISEGLYDSVHEEGPHSKGMLLGSEGSERISVHHNLFAHNDERNPRLLSGLVDIVNNVIYNPGFDGGWGPSHITGYPDKVPVNYVGNYYKSGVNSGTAEYYISTSDPAEIFVQGNITRLRPFDVIPEAIGVVRPSDWQWVVETRHPAPPITTTTADEAFDQVLQDAGVTCPARDAVDQRIIDDVINGTGQFVDDPADVGGWPELDPGAPPLDSDHDGMPNVWEIKNGYDPNDPSDGSADANGDGYTNLEDYLNGCGVESNPLVFLPNILNNSTE